MLTIYRGQSIAVIIMAIIIDTIETITSSTPKIAHGSQNGNQTQNHVSQAGLLVNLIIKNTNHVIKPIAPIGN